MAVVMLLCSVTVSAYDFEVDSIFYNVTTDSTVEVTYKGSYDSSYDEYSGNIEIPEKVTYNEKTYSVTSIGYSAFSMCNGLTNVTIPNSVTSIEKYAFKHCSSLTSVAIPNSVTSIEHYAFSGCSGLTSIVIPNSVTRIGFEAFSSCSGLTSISIPNSVTSIGKYAFNRCTGLTSIYMLSETPVKINSYTFDNYDATLYVPQGSIEAYKAADIWKEFANIVEFDPTGIEDVTEDTPAFEVTAGGIRFTAAEGKAVAVYTATGALVEKIDSYAGEEIAPGKGVYIVRVGNKTVKVKL